MRIWHHNEAADAMSDHGRKSRLKIALRAGGQHLQVLLETVGCCPNLRLVNFAKLLELLKEIAPRVTRVAILSNPDADPASWFNSATAAAPKPGVLTLDEMAIDRVLADGAVIGACNIALKVLSGKLAQNAGVSAEEAAKEWAANIIPGITVIPSGTWGVNRAQEHGCTYCAGG